MEYIVRLHFPTSNNTAEYEALISGLRITVELEIKHLEIRGDSELVVGQVMRDKNCIDPKMSAYCQVVRDMEGKFHGLELHHVLRDYNKASDILAKAASSQSQFPTGFSRVTNISHLYKKKARSHPRSRSPKSWRLISHQK
jgi:ribonuclease HI